LQFSHQAYCAYALANGLPEAVGLCGDNHLLWLDFIFSHKVQPLLGENALCMIYAYPACQASLARISTDNPNTVDRVELFINGIELGNGFYELSDAGEQDRRFTKEMQVRQDNSLPPVSKDQRLLAALAAGLPDCSGIAIGLDRLLMVLAHAKTISETLSFSINRA